MLQIMKCSNTMLQIMKCSNTLTERNTSMTTPKISQIVCGKWDGKTGNRLLFKMFHTAGCKAFSDEKCTCTPALEPITERQALKLSAKGKVFKKRLELTDIQFMGTK